MLACLLASYVTVLLFNRYFLSPESTLFSPNEFEHTWINRALFVSKNKSRFHRKRVSTRTTQHQSIFRAIQLDSALRTRHDLHLSLRLLHQAKSVDAQRMIWNVEQRVIMRVHPAAMTPKPKQYQSRDPWKNSIKFAKTPWSNGL